MGAADIAWTVLAVMVLGYEGWAGRARAELLSEAVDRYRSRHPIITLSLILYLAAHLSRMVPRRFDPLHLMAVRLGR